MKVKIIRLSKKDAHYGYRKMLIGLTGNILMDEYSTPTVDKENGWSGIAFIPDNNPFPHLPVIHFAYVKFEQVKS